jgi:hypothetical protein
LHADVRFLTATFDTHVSGGVCSLE